MSERTITLTNEPAGVVASVRQDFIVPPWIADDEPIKAAPTFPVGSSQWKITTPDATFEVDVPHNVDPITAIIRGEAVPVA